MLDRTIPTFIRRITDSHHKIIKSKQTDRVCQTLILHIRMKTRTNQYMFKEK